MSVVPTGQADPDRTRAIQLYSAFGASLILMMLPYVAAAYVSIIMLMIVFLMASTLRRKSGETSLSKSHAAYIVRTIWIGSILALITLAFGAMYLLQYVDNTALEPCMRTIMDHAQSIDADSSAMALQPYLQPCVDGFVKTNIKSLIISAVIAIAPVLVYFIYRFVRGLNRAIGGYRIANPKAWF